MTKETNYVEELRTKSFREEVLAALWAIVALEAFRGGSTFHYLIGMVAAGFSTVSFVGSIYYSRLARKDTGT